MIRIPASVFLKWKYCETAKYNYFPWITAVAYNHKVATGL